MAKLFDRLDDHLRDWISRQLLFFVATAPLDSDGRVNVSPKGPIGTLRVVDDHTIAYLDIFGSGSETIAHLRENGRICVMLCSFEGPPRILRLHGRGEPVFPEDPRFQELLDELQFEEATQAEARRSLILVHVERIADSCGYDVPLMDYVGQREHHPKAVAKRVRVMGAEGYTEYARERNGESIDGLPAVPTAPESAPTAFD
jgi:predicted pyridoxine 5'-phosphate oxidase superfamily flavin-nucleotide-binding protein